MKKYADLIKASLLMVAIVVVFGLSAFGLNFHTSELIAAHSAGAANAALEAVMPENAGFEQLYDAANPSATTLTVVPAPVVPTGDKTDGTSGEITAIYKEKSGKGFVFTFKMVTKFSKDKTPMVYTVGVTSEGTICGITENEYYDSKIVGAGFVSSFIGNDSSLASVELVADVTYSSKAVVAAVSAGLTALIDNNLITAGVKSDAQILEELISTVVSSFKKSPTAVTVSGNISAAYRLANDAGFVYFMTEGDSTYLAICNNFGVCKVFTYETDEESGDVLKDITSEKTALANEASVHANANAKNQFTKAQKEFKKMAGVENESVVAINTTVDIFNTVVAIAEITVGENTYYGFYSRSYGFEDMNVYIILDQDGKIFKIKAAEIVFAAEHFHENSNGVIFEGIPTDYLDKMIGKDNATFTDDLTVITAATMSSDAMRVSLKDAFAAFAALKGGKN